MKKQAILSAVLLCLILPSCCAGQVTLVTGQNEYYVLTGGDAALPLTLNNTYDHDITGVLRYTAMAEKPGGNVTTVQEKTFTLFVGERLYLLPAGRSDVPLTLHADVAFLYPEGGGRRASLEGIVVHFVKDKNEIRVNLSPRESTDVPDPSAGSGGSMSVSGATVPPVDPLKKVQNNQARQDVQSLRQQLLAEDTDALRIKTEFLSLLMQDSTLGAINRTLVSNGFALAGSEVSLQNNISGNFSLWYEEKSRSAVVSGSVDGGRFLFADESGGGALPLPGPLTANETFRSSDNALARSGFFRNATLMHYTAGGVMVNLTYRDEKSRQAHLKAEIFNGTVTGIGLEPADEPSPALFPVLAVVLICLLSGGILFLGRRLPRIPPKEAEKPRPEETRSGYKKTAETMLDEAAAMAGQGLYPDAYARAGRALRFILSQRLGNGDELTNEEIGSLFSLHGATSDRVREILSRCSMVAFAKGTPDPEEFTGILAAIRQVLSTEDGKDTLRK